MNEVYSGGSTSAAPSYLFNICGDDTPILLPRPSMRPVLLCLCSWTAAASPLSPSVISVASHTARNHSATTMSTAHKNHL